MSGTINNLANSGYYQLANTNGGQSQGANAGTNTTQSLMQALSGQNVAAASSSDAYLLSLSPQAQQYLNSVNGGASPGDALVSALNGASGSNSSNSGNTLLGALDQAIPGSNLPGTQSSFTLSSKQQDAITAILTKYKDAPYNQDTFNQIQNDLNTAGLGTATLSMTDQAKSFNPAMILVNALNGGSTDSSNTGVPSAGDEQAKSSSYIQSIISQWQNISGKNTTASAGNSRETPADAVTAVSSGSGA